MGLIRKVLSVPTLGIVRPRSFKQRQAKKQTKYLKQIKEQGDPPKLPKLSGAERREQQLENIARNREQIHQNNIKTAEEWDKIKQQFRGFGRRK